MTAIMQALNAGHSTKKILKYLSQQNPELAAKISGALEAGHTIDHIMNFISKNEKRMGNLVPEKREERNPFKKIQTNIHPALTGASKAIGTAAGALGGGYALSRAIPSILQRGTIANASNAAASVPNVSGNAPQTPLQANQNKMQPNNVLPNNTIQSTQQTPVNPLSLNSTQEEINAHPSTKNITQQPNIKQPEIKPIDLKALLKDKYNGFTGKIEDLRKSNDTQTIAEYFKKFAAGTVGKLEKESGQPIEKIVEQYLKENPLKFNTKNSLENEKTSEDVMNPSANEIRATPEQLKEIQKPPKEEEIQETEEEISPKIEKSSIVNSPNGIGEVKEIRNGQALIDVDGKLHKVKEEDLESSPIPEKDLAELHAELIKGIESETGEDISRMVQWAGYDPETNTLKFLPHSGDLYTYDDISEEDAALLRDVLSTRKTSGSNFIGAWKKDSKSPIGAAMSKLIRKLQLERGGKGNEYSAKHGTIYSAYEPAIEAKKRKKKKK
jgi:hypothetical protein